MRSFIAVLVVTFVAACGGKEDPQLVELKDGAVVMASLPEAPRNTRQHGLDVISLDRRGQRIVAVVQNASIADLTNGVPPVGYIDPQSGNVVIPGSGSAARASYEL